MALASGRVRVWDVPTRLTHWLLVVSFGVSWWTAETHRMEWHRWSGYAMLALLLFRLYWGFFGSSTARFSQFLRGPREVWEHVRHLPHRAPTGVYGHNALGALSVVAMLLVLVTQVVMGLFAVDVDGIESGPLSYLVEFDTGRAFAEWHAVGFEILQWLIALHLFAILYYLLYKRDNLIGAMVSGKKHWSETAVTDARLAPWWQFVIGVAFAAVVTWYITKS